MTKDFPNSILNAKLFVWNCRQSTENTSFCLHILLLNPRVVGSIPTLGDKLFDKQFCSVLLVLSLHSFLYGQCSIKLSKNFFSSWKASYKYLFCLRKQPETREQYPKMSKRLKVWPSPFWLSRFPEKKENKRKYFRKGSLGQDKLSIQWASILV